MLQDYKFRYRNTIKCSSLQLNLNSCHYTNLITTYELTNVTKCESQGTQKPNLNCHQYSMLYTVASTEMLLYLFSPYSFHRSMKESKPAGYRTCQ
jgi:hypothetical protein